MLDVHNHLQKKQLKLQYVEHTVMSFQVAGFELDTSINLIPFPSLSYISVFLKISISFINKQWYATQTQA